MGIPISPLIDLLNAAICAFCGYRLFRSYQKDKQILVFLFFSQAYLALVFAYIFLVIPRLFLVDNSLYIGIGFVLAQASMYFAVVYFSKVTFFFIKPKWMMRVFWAVLSVSIVAIVLNVLFFEYPSYDIGTGITSWNTHPVVSIISIVVFLGVLLPSSIYFLQHGFRSSDRVVRIRSSAIGVGLLFLMITAYTYYTATTQMAALISDLLSLLTYLIIFFGVVYRRDRPQADESIIKE